MANLVLHLGDSRTGSTSIQAALSGSRPLLAQNGVLYPETGIHYKSHHLFAKAIHGGSGIAPEIAHAPTFTLLLEQLRNEIQRSNCETVVMSSDLFSKIFKLGYSAGAEVRLEQLFSVFREVRVILFVRHQALTRESAYRFFVMWPERSHTGDFRDPVKLDQTGEMQKKPTENRDEVSSFKRMKNHSQDPLGVECSYLSVRPDLDFQYVSFHEAKSNGLLVKTFFDRAGISSCYSGEVKTNDSLSRQGTLAVLMWNRGLVPATMRRDEFVDWARLTFPEKYESLYNEEYFSQLSQQYMVNNEKLLERTGIALNHELDEFMERSTLCGSDLTPEFQERVLALHRVLPRSWKQRMRKYIPFLSG